ncbi:short-chain dehydrogenase/reductase SDR [Scytonema sp. HK-05]|nr:short-chain dehydrogenase/reductase SDR [Scytonema sp. HK-05]
MKLALEGAQVVVNYSSSLGKAEEVVNEIKKQNGEAIAIKADMSDVAQSEQLVALTVEKYGKLDILVSNAGIEHFGPFEEVTQEEFDKTFAVNTRGQFFAMQKAAKQMKNGGRLICTSSISASKGFVNHSVYGGSKGAIEAFARNLAVDLGPRGITVNAIAPGATKTDMYEQNAALYRDPDSKLSVDQQMKKFSPLGRVGTPEDIANVVAFLASDEGGWITGQVIHITGGMA